jgi:hypothetical protein
MCLKLRMVDHEIISEDGVNYVEIRIRKRVGEGGSFLKWEEELAIDLQKACQYGTLAEAQSRDTQGEALVDENGTKWTTKGQILSVLESPGGPVPIYRHVYQPSCGGTTRCPMDERLGLIGSATPRFARMLASKVAEAAAPAVKRDLEENHYRPISDSYCQDMGERVNHCAQVHSPLSQWEPESHYLRVSKIVVGVDGAMINTRYESWRQALCGTFTLYDWEGSRLETIYIGKGPGDTAPLGKVAFFAEMETVLQKLKLDYPKAEWLGLSDAASDFVAWLKQHTSEWLVDYHHAAEYITKASQAFLNYVDARGEGHLHFAHKMRHQLQDKKGGALAVLKEFTDQRDLMGSKLSKSALDGLESAITYFTNHHKHMNYKEWKELNRPIGSGPTEAACKTIIKDRMTKSGMRWSVPVADQIIALRALHRSPTRWKKFWVEHEERTKRRALSLRAIEI